MRLGNSEPTVSLVMKIVFIARFKKAIILCLRLASLTSFVIMHVHIVESSLVDLLKERIAAEIAASQPTNFVQAQATRIRFALE